MMKKWFGKKAIGAAFFSAASMSAVVAPQPAFAQPCTFQAIQWCHANWQRYNYASESDCIYEQRPIFCDPFNSSGDPPGGGYKLPECAPLDENCFPT